MQELKQITKRQDKINSIIAKATVRLEKLKAMSLEQWAKKKKMATDDMGEVKFWYDYDVRNVERQIEDNLEKLSEAKRLDEKEYERTYKKLFKVTTHQKIMASLPDTLRQFMENAKESMLNTSLKHREELLVIKKEWDEKRATFKNWKERWEFDKNHRFEGYHAYLIGTTVEKLKKDIDEEVENDIVSLVSRVWAKIGDITNATDLHYNRGIVNGVVYGESGDKVTVNSILAGGYNIQRLHIRTLLK